MFVHTKPLTIASILLAASLLASPTASAGAPTSRGNATPGSAAVATAVRDADGDGVPDGTDNCPAVPNPDQRNTDAAPIPVGRGSGILINGAEYDTTVPNADGLGDACDPDDDNDGLPHTSEGVFPATACLAASAAADPLAADSDGDGVVDGEECALGTDPASAASKPPPDNTCVDTDGDHVRDALEVRGWGTDPNNADSDGDGLPDGVEVYIVNDIHAGWVRVNNHLDSSAPDFAAFPAAGADVVITLNNGHVSNAQGYDPQYPRAGYPFIPKAVCRADIDAALAPSLPYLSLGRQVWVQAENEVTDVTYNPSSTYWRGTTDQYLAQLAVLYDEV